MDRSSIVSRKGEIMQAYIEIMTAALPEKRTIAHSHEWYESDGTEKCRKCGAVNRGIHTRPYTCWDMSAIRKAASALFDDTGHAGNATCSLLSPARGRGAAGMMAPDEP